MRAWFGAARAFNDDKQHLPVDKREVVDDDDMITEVSFPEETSIGEALATVTSPQGVWARQSPDSRPLWVASDEKGLAYVLSEHWRDEDGPLEIREIPA